MNDFVGRHTRIYMKNGYVFHGAVLSWSENEVSIKTPQGEVVFIPNISEICAYAFIQKKDSSFLNESTIKEEKKEGSNVDRIKSLVELYKLRAESERELAKHKLKSPICAGEQVEYDTISVLRSLKNTSGE